MAISSRLTELSNSSYQFEWDLLRGPDTVAVTGVWCVHVCDILDETSARIAADNDIMGVLTLAYR